MKAQISIEFIVGVVILLFIYTFALGIFSNYSQHNIMQSERIKQLCYTVTSAIDSASIGGSGFAVNTTLAKSIGPGDYTISISNKSIVSVDWDDQLFACSTTTQNVTPLSFTQNKFSAVNINGTVYISAIQTNSTYELGEKIGIVGRYFLGNVSLTITNSSGKNVITAEIENVNNSFFYNWTPSSKGEYKVYATDTLYKNLNAEKDITVS